MGPGLSLDVLRYGRIYYPVWESNHVSAALPLIPSVIKERTCNDQQCVFVALAFKRRYTGCPRRNVPDFGRVFLMLKYTDITPNTYVQS